MSNRYFGVPTSGPARAQREAFGLAYGFGGEERDFGAYVMSPEFAVAAGRYGLPLGVAITEVAKRYFGRHSAGPGHEGIVDVSRPGMCYRCAEIGHSRRQCTNAPVTFCSQCGRLGRRSVDCCMGGVTTSAAAGRSNTSKIKKSSATQTEPLECGRTPSEGEANAARISVAVQASPAFAPYVPPLHEQPVTSRRRDDSESSGDSDDSGRTVVRRGRAFGLEVDRGMQTERLFCSVCLHAIVL